MPRNAKRQLNGLKRTQALLALGFSLVLASHAAASLETAGSLIQPPAIASPVNNTFDTVGQLTTHNPGSNADTLTWDALGRLVSVQRNPTGNGFSWSAVYDGFGRRLQTSQQTITGGTNSGSPLVAQSSYDPDVHFLEAALTVNGTREWLVHGPDLDGGYGDLQGTGGVDAVVNDSTSAATGVFSDIYGHAVATVSSSTVTWNTVRSSGYGPQPGTTALPLDGVHDDSTFFNWHGKYVDGTGYYHLGNRYYDPTSGTFISCDPLGHAASMDLYSYCNGDPVNYFDADGRMQSKFSANIQQGYGLDQSASLAFTGALQDTAVSTGNPYLAYPAGLLNAGMQDAMGPSPRMLVQGGINFGLSNYTAYNNAYARFSTADAGVTNEDGIAPSPGLQALSYVALYDAPVAGAGYRSFGYYYNPFTDSVVTPTATQQLQSAGTALTQYSALGLMGTGFIGEVSEGADAIRVAPPSVAGWTEDGSVLVGGTLPRNYGLAGTTHPVTGIPFNAEGFPDFSSVSIKNVEIEYTGTRAGDFAAANAEAGFTETPQGFTWHHVEDGKTMQLVPEDIHAATGHTGGFSLYPQQ